MMPSVAFSPDGKRIIIGHHDGAIHVRTADGSPDVVRLAGHTSIVRHVAFSPDGTRFASAGGDGTIRIWDAQKLELP